MSLPPRRFAWLVLAVNLVVCAVAIGLGYHERNRASHQFEEGALSTYLSCTQLLLTGLFAWLTLLARRRQAGWSGLRTPWLVWLCLAAGFVFLAADDALRIHERMDKLIHKIFHLHETGLSDRIDDFIIVVYALIGLGVLSLYRRELLLVRRSWPYWTLGVVFTFIHSVFDALGNRDDLLTMVLHDPVRVYYALDYTETLEGVSEAIAEGFLLAALYCSAYLVRQPRPPADQAAALPA